MEDWSNLSAEDIYSRIVEHKKNLRNCGGVEKLYDFLCHHEGYKESIFVKDKAVASFRAYVSKIKENKYKQRPRSESSGREDFVLLLNGIEDFLTENDSTLLQEVDKPSDFVYLIGYYPDVKLSENHLAKFKKMVLALHKDKDKAELHFYDSKEKTKDIAIGTYTIEDNTTVINITHKNQKTSQIRLYNPSKSITRYLGGFAMIMYSSRYSEVVAMKAIFEKKISAQDALDELSPEKAFTVPPQVVPALIESVIQFPGERNSEFEGLKNMKDFQKHQRLEKIKGLYIGYYISQKDESLNSLVAIILTNGKTILLTENFEEPYSGQFSFLDEVNIIGRFHYSENSPSRNDFRFQFNCKEEDIHTDLLTGTYSGRSASSNEPMAGRILFQKIENIDKKLQDYIDYPNEKEVTELEITNLLKNKKYIKTYLFTNKNTEIKNTEKYIDSIHQLKKDSPQTFETVINFFLGYSDKYIESFNFLKEHLYSLRANLPSETTQFQILKGLYYLFSFETEDNTPYLSCNPIEITLQGQVRMRKMGSENEKQFYIGKAVRKTDRLSLIFTHLDEEEIFPICFMSSIGGSYEKDEFIPTLSLSAIKRANPKASRDFLVKIKSEKEVPLENLKTFKVTSDEIEITIEEELSLYIEKEVCVKVSNFVFGEYNNLIKSTKNNSGSLDRKQKPWEIYFATAVFYATKDEKSKAIDFLSLAEQHRFSYYYKTNLTSTTQLFNDEKNQEIFNNLGINFKAYLNSIES